MNKDKTQDKKVLDIFMDDSPWLNKIRQRKKTVEKEQKKDLITENNKLIKEGIYENHDTTDIYEKEFGEVDYAILKSITYGFKTINQISKALQIRTIIVEKHIYKLIKEGFIKYFQYCVLTSKGKYAIEDFEKNNPEDIWKPIDEYIVSVIEHKKEQNLKTQRLIDIILLISTIALIILIIYYGIFS